MKHRRWTQEECDIITRYYPSKGAAYCATKLERTLNAIKSQAQKMGISFGDTKAVFNGDVMLITDVAAEAGCPWETVYSRLHREPGVIRHYYYEGEAISHKRAYVPSDWAWAFIDEYRTLAENAKNHPHWLPTKEAADLLGLHFSTLVYYIQGRQTAILHYLQGLRYVRVLADIKGNPPYRFNPEDVERIKRHLDEDRAQTANWELFKAISLDTGASPKMVSYVAHKIASPRKMLRGGRWVWLVSPADGVKLREYFGLDMRVAA